MKKILILSTDNSLSKNMKLLSQPALSQFIADNNYDYLCIANAHDKNDKAYNQKLERYATTLATKLKISYLATISNEKHLLVATILSVNTVISPSEITTLDYVDLAEEQTNNAAMLRLKDVYKLPANLTLNMHSLKKILQESVVRPERGSLKALADRKPRIASHSMPIIPTVKEIVSNRLRTNHSSPPLASVEFSAIPNTPTANTELEIKIKTIPKTLRQNETFHARVEAFREIADARPTPPEIKALNRTALSSDSLFLPPAYSSGSDQDQQQAEQNLSPNSSKNKQLRSYLVQQPQAATKPRQVSSLQVAVNIHASSPRSNQISPLAISGLVVSGVFSPSRSIANAQQAVSEEKKPGSKGCCSIM